MKSYIPLNDLSHWVLQKLPTKTQNSFLWKQVYQSQSEILCDNLYCIKILVTQTPNEPGSSKASKSNSSQNE